MNILERCPNCKKVFNKFDMDAVKLEVNLNSALKTYYYCGKSCYNEILKNIGTSPDPINRLEIVHEEVVKDRPLFIRMIVKNNFKVEII